MRAGGGRARVGGGRRGRVRGIDGKAPEIGGALLGTPENPEMIF